ncbi:MAG: MaoC family dehydratase [Devosia sp.]
MTATLPGGTDGPHYDDLEIGQSFDSAPAVELTNGLAAAHHAIVGGRLALMLDTRLARRVTGSSFASPALVWDVSIGQSTLVTQRAIANLFYRGLVFLRAPSIGDTLRTTTTIVGLRPAAPKPDRPPRGLVVMRIATLDQDDRPVLDYFRCAMLPARSADSGGARGELEPTAPDQSAATPSTHVGTWDLGAFRQVRPAGGYASLTEGTTYGVAAGDVITSAPELARLTLNLAAVHHDRSSTGDGRRLVYGGHTIGVALAQVTRALPSLVTVLGWQSCDHTGPVHEGDTVQSTVTVERLSPLASGGMAHLRVLARSTGKDGKTADVLDWRMIGLFA